MTPIFTLISLFLTAFFSGLSVIVFKVKFASSQRLLLSFSGAFLLGICFLHLIPELYTNYNKMTGLFVLAGFVIQLLLEFFSNGIEHGHFHSHDSKKIHLFPFAIFISLCLHAFIEGMALLDNGHSHHGHANANESLLLGIIIHKIPVAIVLTSMLIAKKTSKIITVISLIIFALTAPLGLFLGNLISNETNNYITILMALAVGIFLHISTTILFETSEGHKFDVKKFGIIILGLLTAIFTVG